MTDEASAALTGGSGNSTTPATTDSGGSGATAELQLREQIARDIEAQREKCEHWPIPRGDCWTCQRHGAFTRAARIARGEYV